MTCVGASAHRRRALCAAIALGASCFHAHAQSSKSEPGPAGDPDVATWQPGSAKLAPAREPKPRKDRSEETHPAARLKNVVTALGPGFILHGSGQRAAGNPSEADTLLAVQATGLGLVVVGLGGLAATGASRYTAGPLAATMIAGAGLFGTSYLADVYATARPHDSVGNPPTRVPVSESEIGYRSINDPQWRYRHFLVQALTLRAGRFILAPQGWFALDDRNARVSAHLSYRFEGPLPSGPRSADGSYWDLSLGASHHRYDSDGFRISGGEVLTRVRRDLFRHGGAFRGAFTEGALGVGLLRTDYNVEATDIPTDYNDSASGRAGFRLLLR